MKIAFLTAALFTCVFITAQDRTLFLTAGMDFRGYPIDIENVARGGYNSNGLPNDEKFWTSVSFDSKTGIQLKKNWRLSLTVCSRYNHLNWLQGKNLMVSPVAKRKEKKNLKFDILLQGEKQLLLKAKRQYIFVAAGIGLLNINTKYNVFLQDTLPSGPTQGRLYKGNFLHFSPNVSIGYQYKKIRVSLDTHIIEGPDQTNLTSLWIGGTISYEIIPVRKKAGVKDQQ